MLALVALFCPKIALHQLLHGFGNGLRRPALFILKTTKQNLPVVFGRIGRDDGCRRRVFLVVAGGSAVFTKSRANACFRDARRTLFGRFFNAEN